MEITTQNRLLQLYKRVRHVLLLIGSMALVMGFCAPACALAEQAPAAAKFTLVIDAGHGGNDAGAVGAVAKEKVINLKVALAFGKMVEQNCPDVKVVYTRKTDVFVPLQERANIANKAKADLFISIHTNVVASNKGAVYGAETYTLGMHRAADNLEVAKRENSVISLESDYKSKYQGFDPSKAESYIIFELMQDRYMAQSVKLAQAIQQQYGSAGRKNKGVHQAGFLVLRETSMPSVLTELGFISNPNEETYLNSAEGVAQLANSIYKGFRSYAKDAGVAVNDQTSATATPLLADNTPAATSTEPSVRPVKTIPYPTETATPREQSTPSSTIETTTKTEGKKLAAVAEEKKATPAKEAEKKATPAKEAEKKAEPAAAPATAEPVSGQPVFKVQLFTSERELKAGDARLKGLDAQCYKDNGVFKYTYGASTNYQEIVTLKKNISENFNGTFIVAFVDGKRVDLQQAIQQSKKQK